MTDTWLLHGVRLHQTRLRVSLCVDIACQRVATVQQTRDCFTVACFLCVDNCLRTNGHCLHARCTMVVLDARCSCSMLIARCWHWPTCVFLLSDHYRCPCYEPIVCRKMIIPLLIKMDVCSSRQEMNKLVFLLTTMWSDCLPLLKANKLLYLCASAPVPAARRPLTARRPSTTDWPKMTISLLNTEKLYNSFSKIIIDRGDRLVK